MNEWRIEIVTDEYMCNNVTLFADSVLKVNYQTITVDGREWTLPEWLSFAEVEEVV